MKKSSRTFSVYLERRMARILLLGIISGFPWVLIGSSLSLWLKEDGLSRSTIGWAGLIFGVYALNFLWAPLIDRLRVPYLTPNLGHRRAWIVVFQSLIFVCLVGWSLADPAVHLWGVIAIGLVIAIASATQDITIDALRIEQIGTDEGEAMAAGAAVAVVGWWTGYKLGGVVALNTAEVFQQLRPLFIGTDERHDHFVSRILVFLEQDTLDSSQTLLAAVRSVFNDGNNA